MQGSGRKDLRLQCPVHAAELEAAIVGGVTGLLKGAVKKKKKRKAKKAKVVKAAKKAVKKAKKAKRKAKKK